MKFRVALVALVLCASCSQQPTPQRLAQVQQASCNIALRYKLIQQLRAIRQEEDRLSDAALRDQPPGSFARMTELGQRDRDIQDRIYAMYPDENLSAIK